MLLDKGGLPCSACVAHLSASGIPMKMEANWATPAQELARSAWDQIFVDFTNGLEALLTAHGVTETSQPLAPTTPQFLQELQESRDVPLSSSSGRCSAG